MKIQYLGHACFKVVSGDYAIVIDPYAAGSVPGLTDLNETAQLCLCSHGHGDHHGVEMIKVCDNEKESLVSVSVVESWHDDKEGTLRGANKIHVLEAEGVKAVHMGDIGCMPSGEQLEQLKCADVLMIPVGGHYTAQPSVICDMIGQIAPKVVVPMHYRSEKSGFEVIGTCESFLALAEEKLGAKAEYLQTDTLECCGESMNEKTDEIKILMLQQKQWS